MNKFNIRMYMCLNLLIVNAPIKRLIIKVGIHFIKF